MSNAKHTPGSWQDLLAALETIARMSDTTASRAIVGSNAFGEPGTDEMRAIETKWLELDEINRAAVTAIAKAKGE